jgi:DMSO/TMAO reductase YedYZ molybdopterin-dependent catalytic subunit
MPSQTSRKEQEIQMRREGRLPPGQSLTQKFPVLHYGRVAAFNPDTWRFQVWGEVEEEISWSWEEFQRLPMTQIQLDIHCVTRWSKFNTRWKGVVLQDLVDKKLLHIKPTAAYVLQHAAGGYTTNLPLALVLQKNFLLATHYDGEPLTPDHGFPVRGIIGHIPEEPDFKSAYFWKGAKWLIGLEFLTEDQMGFWEKAGYHNEGDIWKEQRKR